jgi:PAS domain-containing protein
MLTAEKGRLEAFLAAFPGEYCGWAPDRSVAYSQGFCKILGIESIRTIADIQSRLAPGDAAALEGLFNRLRSNGLSFSINVANHNQTKVFKISGSQGRALSGQDVFNVLWIEDVTESQSTQKATQATESEKNERLASLEKAFDSIPFPRWLRDSEGKLFWVNKSYMDAVGNTLPDILKDQKEISTSARITKGQKSKLSAGPELAALARSTGKHKAWKSSSTPAANAC